MNQTSENLPKKRKGPPPFSGERAVVVHYAFRPLRPFPAGKPIEVVAEGIPQNHHDGKIVSEVGASVKLLNIKPRSQNERIVCSRGNFVTASDEDGPSWSRYLDQFERGTAS